ncbi:MAG: type I polyketide synthase [Candidatus Aminicenantes bacterium]|nr:MAG: type I polyketide synthase [Candidatus Aminicenantes bacterium]
MSEIPSNTSETGLEIAVIGMACRYPRVRNIDEFWENLKGGVECISFFTEEELIEAGVPGELLQNPNYVRAKAILTDMEYFDSSFFGYTPSEANVMDPQIRILLECSWEALEHAGYDVDTYRGIIGVYVGAGAHPGWEAMALMFGSTDVMGHYTAHHLYDKDHINTRISYNLDLSGPSINVQSACSTTLVAVHLACQGILSGECHMALAGGVRVALHGKKGYLYQEGNILSSDGHCRVFDADASGTVIGEGAGMVVLKALEKAREDEDCIHAVIKGSAVNNSGKNSIGYAAPSVSSQAKVISAAQRAAQVKAESISYIEAHGSGTYIGDSAELQALKQAFNTDKKGFCRIGSVKSNVGHSDAGAGITGFIKTVLALKHRLIPPTLHFKKPNPKIDFENSPFIVNKELWEWKSNPYPRRAGVSSFAVGGAHAHVILEEAPRTGNSTSPSRTNQLILLSAQTPTALDQMSENFLDYLKTNPDINLADAAYTLQVGRKAFKNRRALQCSNVKSAIEKLSDPDYIEAHTSSLKEKPKSVLFMFPGIGSPYMNMGWDLYQTEPLFREKMDHCFEILPPMMVDEIKALLNPTATTANGLQLTEIHLNPLAPVAVFIFKYALAQLIMNWGITPDALVGHSGGEYTAACLAGVFPLENALEIAALRARLMQEIPPHPSTMTNSLLEEFKETLKGVTLNQPRIPIISHLTGKKVPTEDATNIEYWATYLKETAPFSHGLDQLLKEKNFILLEMGPGNGGSFAALERQDAAKKPEPIVIHLFRHPEENIPDDGFLLNQIGQLWLYGIKINWSGFYSAEKRCRLPLPTYPFERQHYPIAGDPFKTINDMLAKDPHWNQARK